MNIIYLLFQVGLKNSPNGKYFGYHNRHLERENPVHGKPKVATSFEANVDYFVDSLELFEALNLEPPEQAKPHDILRTEKEFLETFAFFFNHSAASS